MRWDLPIGTLAGIPIRVHLSVCAVMALLVLVPNGGMATRLAVSGSLLVALCVHELAHALAARGLGLHPREVVLLPLGGTTYLRDEALTPRHELLTALAGPVASLALAGLGWGILVATGEPSTVLAGLPENATPWVTLATVLVWVSGSVGLMNLLPAFPLDGGRMVRAALSGWMGRVRATRSAARMGRLIALCLVGIGLIEQAPLLGCIGLLVFFGASAEERSTVIADIIGNRTVRDVMAPVRQIFEIATPLREVWEALRRDSESRAFVVAFGDRVLGVLHRTVAAQTQALGRGDVALGDLLDRKVVETTAGTSLRDLLTRMGEQQSRAAVVRGADGIDGLVLIENVVQEIRESRDQEF